MVVLIGELDLINKFSAAELQENMLYYFPHSSKSYDLDSNEIPILLEDNEPLKSHTYLLKESEVAAFAKRILDEVAPKIGYLREIQEPNSHKDLLNAKFSARFRVFLRPGYLIDALVDIENTPQMTTIQKTFETAGIQTRETSLEGRKFLVIPGVNTKPIAEKLQKL
jgi:hypothetical protein